MPLMSPQTVLLVLGTVLCWGGPGGVDATNHHRRHHHPPSQQLLEEPPVAVRPKFPYLDRLLHRYDEGKMAHLAVRRPPPTAAPVTTTTTTTRPFLPQDAWKLRQGHVFDYEEDLDNDSEDYYLVSGQFFVQIQLSYIICLLTVVGRFFRES
jgi:hypothetical protein